MDDVPIDLPAPTLVAIEMVVRDLEVALAFFCGAVGMPLAHRGPALDASGHLAVVDLGGIALTLLEPASVGDNVLADREPRFTQLVFDTADIAGVRQRMEQRGIGVEATGPDRAFVPPQVSEGVIGPHVAITFTVVDDSVTIPPASP